MNLERLREREQKIKALSREYFEGFSRLCDSFLDIDLTPRIKDIDCPTLVVVGELDILKHRKFSEIICREIQNSLLKVIPGAGHAVVIENPEELTFVVERFLKEIRSRSVATDAVT